MLSNNLRYDERTCFFFAVATKSQSEIRQFAHTQKDLAMVQRVDDGMLTARTIVSESRDHSEQQSHQQHQQQPHVAFNVERHRPRHYLDRKCFVFVFC